MSEALRAGIVAIVVLLSSHSLADADTLADVRASGELVWGADQEGGGPYVYPRDDDPAEVTGFEVELAERLAGLPRGQAALLPGTVGQDAGPPAHAKDRHHPERLRVDADARSRRWTRRIPYFVYGLQLLARKDDPHAHERETISRSAAARRASGKSASSPARRLTVTRRRASRRGSTSFTTTATPTRMREVETGKLDATLQDTPIAVFYGPRFPALRLVGTAGRARLLRDLRSQRGRGAARGARTSR